MKLYHRKPEDGAPLAQADPYMIKEAGRYYVYASGGHLFSSDHLTEGWRYDGVCLIMPGQKKCWAPCVIKLEDRFYMYYSSMNEQDNDDHGQTMRVAVADSPAGPFRYVKDMLPPFAIDPHVVENASGLYMFYCQNDYEAKRAGTYIRCDRMTDAMTMEGHPADVVRPTLDEEIFKRDRFRPGQHWHTLEGAFYFHVGTTHFMMYSGACYQNPTYFVGYCVAHGPEDADLCTLKWKKYPDEHTYAPLLAKSEWMEGTGHNSVLQDAGKWYIIYHARDNGDILLSQDARSARIDELKIDGDRLSVEVTR
jgi:GH43 family beta-xylosidase